MRLHPLGARHNAPDTSRMRRLPNARSNGDAGVGDLDSERPSAPRRSGRGLLLIASPLILVACLGVVALSASSVRLQSSEARRRGEPLSVDERRLGAADEAPESTFADPTLSHMKPQPRRDSAGAVKLSAQTEGTAPPPPAAESAGAKGRRRAAGRAERTGGGPVLARLHAAGNGAAAGRAAGGYVRMGTPKDESLPPAEMRALRRRFQGRKFLFPLLDQGPNNQFLQFRVALQRAHTLNRTLVLPIWLPHNPKFLHFHPGAPLMTADDH